MKKTSICRFLLLFATFTLISSYPCADPPTAQEYSVETFSGKWFQVAKYQTAGGAYFQRNCTCTEINISKDNNNVNAYQGCIRNGKKVMVNATLVPTNKAGKYTEKIGLNSVGYWVIYLDQNYAVTYDCNSVAGITNYCIHILSRNRHTSRDMIERLSEKALSLGLNKNNLNIEITNQADNICLNTKSFSLQMQNVRSKLKSIRQE